MFLLQDAIEFLVAMPVHGYVVVFWFTLVLELPRYTMGMMALAFIRPGRWLYPDVPAFPRKHRVSLLLCGHNEAHSIEPCIMSLREQSFNDFEIIVVDDGSTDGMSDIVRDLERRGLVTRSARCRLRGGKAAAVNLAARLATGNVFIVLDTDCSFDRRAIELILKPLDDPNVGGVSGSILARNADASVIARIQAVEYLVTISLGRSIMEMFGQVTCVSGAFGAFRREAWEQIGGNDVGAGEDLDFTIRLRKAGWKIAFAPGSICYTEVPATLWNLIRQRLRWERDSVWLRYRKHHRLMLPFSHEFRWSEALHQWDFLIFHVFLTALFPVYTIYLGVEYGIGAVLILTAVAVFLSTLDVFAFLVAVAVMRRWEDLRMLPTLLYYGLFNTFVMRLVRLYAYLDEWIFSSSLKDDYVPGKVRAWGYWR